MRLGPDLETERPSALVAGRWVKARSARSALDWRQRLFRTRLRRPSHSSVVGKTSSPERVRRYPHRVTSISLSTHNPATAPRPTTPLTHNHTHSVSLTDLQKIGILYFCRRKRERVLILYPANTTRWNMNVCDAGPTAPRYVVTQTFSLFHSASCLLGSLPLRHSVIAFYRP